MHAYLLTNKFNIYIYMINVHIIIFEINLTHVYLIYHNEINP